MPTCSPAKPVAWSRRVWGSWLRTYKACMFLFFLMGFIPMSIGLIGLMGFREPVSGILNHGLDSIPSFA